MATPPKLRKLFGLLLVAPLMASAPMVTPNDDADDILETDSLPALAHGGRTRSLVAISKALEEFRLLSPTMPVAQIQAFILVAIDERLGMSDVADMTGVKPSTASRYLLDLGIARTALDNSFGLLDRGIDPVNTRKARYTLTRRGKALINRLVDALSVAVGD